MIKMSNFVRFVLKNYKIGEGIFAGVYRSTKKHGSVYEIKLFKNNDLD